MKYLKRIASLLLFSAFIINSALAEVKNANNQEIIALMKNGVPLIDVRTYDEWRKTGVIKDSKLLTFFDKDGGSNLKEWMHDLRKIVSQDEPVIILCRSGKRSGIVSNILSDKMQYSNIYNASSGIIGWINDGQKTTTSGLSNAK